MDSFLLKMDAFRKIPQELTNPTMHGAYLTVCAYVVMGLLFLMELTSYLSTNVNKTIDLDPHYAENMWIDFNIIMHELPCQYTKIVVRDIVGNQEIEILDQNIHKESIDARTGTFKGKIDRLDRVTLEKEKNENDNDDSEPTHIHETNPDLESDWISTSDHFHHDSFDKVISFHDFTMINFYAEWCIHCRRFAPTWIEAEQKADKLRFRDKNRREVNAKLLRVNCVEFGQVCAEQGVRAYPTVRLYKNDGTYVQYKGERAMDPILKFAKDFISNEALPSDHQIQSHYSETEEGCRVRGELQVRRVPGYFLLEADSNADSLEPSMTNVSHTVEHIWFVDNKASLSNFVRSLPKSVTNDIVNNLQPMQSMSYVTWKQHQAPQHFVQVIPTILEDSVVVYQASVQSITTDVDTDKVPEARFQYSFSPMVIKVSRESRPFYDFLTSVFAIVGGTYTFISLVDRFWDTVSNRYKTNIGKLG